MRIGILTLPSHANYGGILQTYALQTVLENLGHNVIVFHKNVDGVRKISAKVYPFVLLKRFLRKCFINHSVIVLLESKRRREASIITRNTDGFITKYIHTNQVTALKEISPVGLDAIVVGSDQIWRPNYVELMWKADIQDAFLKFSKKWDIKRVAYAVSFGVDIWQYSNEETLECKNLVQLFDAVSVRETSALKLCLDNLDIEARIVLDPTLLLDANDYLKLIRESNDTYDTEELFIYILDETKEKRDLIAKVSDDLGIAPHKIVLNNCDFSVPVERRIIPPVEQWLKGFYDAKFVVTDSFHGCVFSIIFRKPFVAIGNASRGMSRFMSLLGLFNLEHHLLSCADEYSSFSSYALPLGLDNRIANLKEQSLEFLKTNLS